MSPPSCTPTGSLPELLPNSGRQWRTGQLHPFLVAPPCLPHFRASPSKETDRWQVRVIFVPPSPLARCLQSQTGGSRRGPALPDQPADPGQANSLSRVQIFIHVGGQWYHKRPEAPGDRPQSAEPSVSLGDVPCSIGLSIRPLDNPLLCAGCQGAASEGDRATSALENGFTRRPRPSRAGRLQAGRSGGSGDVGVPASGVNRALMLG